MQTHRHPGAANKNDLSDRPHRAVFSSPAERSTPSHDTRISSMKLKFILAALVASTASSSSVVADEAPARARSQLESQFATQSTGFGPQVFGVAPGRTMLSLYGTVDLSLNYMHSGSKSLWRVQSGNGWTSKFGIYAQEDLGQGWTTFVRLESGLLADTGKQQDSTTLFNRAAVIGISSADYGQLAAGRMYTAIGTAAIGADVYLGNAHESAYTYMLGIADVDAKGNADGPNRTNNTLRYTSPRAFGRVWLDGSASLKDNRSVSPSMHSKSIALNYGDRSDFAGIGYGQSWCDPAISGSCSSPATDAPSVRTDMIVASAMHDFGPLIGQAAYVRLSVKDGGAHFANLYTMGMQRLAGDNYYKAALVYRNTSTDKDWAYGATLGLDHFLSKRTALYVRLTGLHNGPNSRLIYDYDTPYLPVDAGKAVSDATFGMYHNF
ncbi:MAG: hypothetical protein JWQ11_381 [Rhizobacter sp.]|nr:hypothetical protein [Rhizobacter sp.]